MTTPNFRRSVRLEFYGEGVAVNPVTDLRVAFEVDHNIGVQMSHALITVYNLNATSRRHLAKPMPLDPDLRPSLSGPAVSARLFAGYADDLALIYDGDLQWAHVTKAGPDWVTQMNLFTGLYAATNSFVNIGFAKPTPARTIIEEILKPLRLSVDYTPEAAQVLAGREVQSYTISNQPFQEANDFLRRFGLAFLIKKNAQGLVYRPTRPRIPNQPADSTNTFSPDNGLVGAPKILSYGVEVKALLRPQLGLFDKFYVRSETTRGTLQNVDYAAEYYVTHIKHSGDTHGQEWYTEIEGAYATINEIGMGAP